jgi:hypothetical protein
MMKIMSGTCTWNRGGGDGNLSHQTMFVRVEMMQGRNEYRRNNSLWRTADGVGCLGDAFYIVFCIVAMVSRKCGMNYDKR